MEQSELLHFVVEALMPSAEVPPNSTRQSTGPYGAQGAGDDQAPETHSVQLHSVELKSKHDLISQGS